LSTRIPTFPHLFCLPRRRALTRPRISAAFLGDTVGDYGLVALVSRVETCRALGTGSAPLDIGVFGQFKRVESPLVSAVSQWRAAAPVGCVPTTAVVTRVPSGNASASVTCGQDRFRDRSGTRRQLSQRARNPENREQAVPVDGARRCGSRRHYDARRDAPRTGPR